MSEPVPWTWSHPCYFYWEQGASPGNKYPAPGRLIWHSHPAYGLQGPFQPCKGTGSLLTQVEAGSQHGKPCPAFGHHVPMPVLAHCSYIYGCSLFPGLHWIGDTSYTCLWFVFPSAPVVCGMHLCKCVIATGHCGKLELLDRWHFWCYGTDANPHNTS